MHWFWRVVVAVGVGVLYGVVSVSFGERVCDRLVARLVTLMQNQVRPGDIRTGLAVGLVYFLPASLAVMAAWSVLGRASRRTDSETRCRKCGYILRGLTEPRCPECGSVR